MKKYCMAVDLVDDPQRIEEYETYHQKLQPEIEQSIRDAGVTNMEIFRIGTRLFMIMETEDDFSFEVKAEMDLNNPKVQIWEALMGSYQVALPQAKPGDKWVLMKQIFGINL
jgi:L-rhamnose mutarotase